MRAALSQIADGSVVELQVAGRCGVGVLRAARAKHVFAIGVDTDQGTRAALGDDERPQARRRRRPGRDPRRQGRDAPDRRQRRLRRPPRRDRLRRLELARPGKHPVRGRPAVPPAAGRRDPRRFRRRSTRWMLRAIVILLACARRRRRAARRRRPGEPSSQHTGLASLLRVGVVGPLDVSVPRVARDARHAGVRAAASARARRRGQRRRAGGLDCRRGQPRQPFRARRRVRPGCRAAESRRHRLPRDARRRSSAARSPATSSRLRVSAIPGSRWIGAGRPGSRPLLQTRRASGRRRRDRPRRPARRPFPPPARSRRCRRSCAARSS